MLTACHDRVAPIVPTLLAMDRTPVTLAEPGVFDWSTQQVTGQAIAGHRAEYVKRRVQAFSAASGWTATGNAVNTFGAGAPAIPASDYVPNGPATVYGTSGTPASCIDKVFFLTQSGILLKVAKDRTSVQKLALGRSFSKTYVTLSPAGGRAYLLSDDGYFFVVNTDTMTFQSLGSLGASNNQGLAPVLDPFTSNHADAQDDVYVATSDGKVRHYRVTGGTTPVATAVATHTISTSSFKSSPIVLGGIVYIGDQSGNFIRFDANTGLAISTTPLAYPINATAALDLDAAGNVAHAFVNAGTRCHWIDYAAGGMVVSSRPLYLDESDDDRSGTIADWGYGTSSSKYWLAVTEALSINTEAGPVNLPGFASFKTTAHLTPAQTNTRASGTTPAGGPVHAYLRWDVANSFLPNNAIVNGMKLWLNADNPADRNIRPYSVRSTSAYLNGNPASGVWTAAAMTLGNRPSIGGAIGTWTTPAAASGAHSRVTFTNGDWYAWNVTSYPTSLPTQYAIGLYDDGADAPMWPGGPGTPDPGNAPSHTLRYAPQFYNNPAVTSPHSYVTGTGVADPTNPIFTANSERRALLEVSAAAKALPSVSIATPPIVDTFGGRKFVYVFNGNTVFGLDFTSSTTFADGAGTSTRFNVTRTGTKGVGSYKPTFPPTGANADVYVVENTAAPLLSFDGSSLFVLDRYPADANLPPLGYTYALNRIALPLRTDDALGYTNYQEFASVTNGRNSSSHLVLDYFDYGAGSGALHFALPTTATGSGKLYRLLP